LTRIGYNQKRRGERDARRDLLGRKPTAKRIIVINESYFCCGSGACLRGVLLKIDDAGEGSLGVGHVRGKAKASVSFR